MWLDVFKWPEMIKYKKERDDQFAGTEGVFDHQPKLKSVNVSNSVIYLYSFQIFFGKTLLIFMKTPKP